MSSFRPIVAAGGLYFLLVFGAGFVLGVIRTLVLLPVLEARTAELLEVPLMLAVIYFAARLIVHWLTPRLPEQKSSATAFFAVGSLALALLLLAEFGFVLQLRGLSLAEYFATRDPVAGAAYYGSLLIYWFAPLVLSKRAGAS